VRNDAEVHAPDGFHKGRKRLIDDREIRTVAPGIAGTAAMTDMPERLSSCSMLVIPPTKCSRRNASPIPAHSERNRAALRMIRVGGKLGFAGGSAAAMTRESGILKLLCCSTC